jgi:transcriptional regulator with XRE-family HTH domain
MNRSAEGFWQTACEIREAIRDHIASGAATQSSLALAACISQGQLSQVLRGKKSVSIGTLDTIAQAAKVRITSTITPEGALRSPPANREAPGGAPAPGKRGRKQPANHPLRRKL